MSLIYLSHQKKDEGLSVGFDATWKKCRPWLSHRVEETDDGNIFNMYCSLCQSFKATGLNNSKR